MYKAIVIGAGSIGALKSDKYDSPTTENILTHAHMYYNHPEVELMGIFDTDIQKSAAAQNKWHGKFGIDFQDVDWSMEDKVDIISVCVPTNSHKQVLLDILDYEINPKIVIAEKPFCNNSQEAREVIEEYGKAGIPIIINYPRRYVPEIRELRNDIWNEKYGKIYSVVLSYTRGIRREASHFIDLCFYLFGDYNNGILLNRKNVIKDNPPEETLSAYLSFEKCPHVFLSPCDGRQYKVFQLEIMTEKGKIILSQHGMYIDYYPLIEEPIWGGFKILSKDIETRIKTQLNKSLEYLLDNAIKYLDALPLVAGYKFQCTAEDAIKTQRVLDSLYDNI